MDRVNYNIKEEFKRELNEISYICENLKSGKVFELTGNKQDGSLRTNIENIAKQYNDILERIQDGRGSVLTEASPKFQKLFSEDKK